MQTIKTAVVVVLLLGVCYGAYVALNAPEPVLPPEYGLEDWKDEAPEVSFDSSGSVAVDIPQLPGNAGGTSAPPAPSLPTLSLPGANSAKPKDKLNAPAMAELPKSDFPQPELPKLDLPPTAGPSVAADGSEGPSVPLPNAAEGPKVDLPKLDFPTASGLAGNTSLPAGLALPGGPNTTELENKGHQPGDLTSIPGTLISAPAGLDGSAQDKSNALPTGFPEPSPPAVPKEPQGVAASTPIASAGAAMAQPKQTFESARKSALKSAADGKLREALVEMSLFYNNPEVTHEQHLDLVDILDALAAEVIYSKRHLLEPMTIVSPGETLESIAAKHKVAPELLTRINSLGDTRVVLTGTQLKTVTGPFRAEVNLNRGELTLFLNDMYAGRFPISVGTDPAPRSGTFEVIEKRRDRTYYGAGGNIFKGDDPRNPYGGVWIDLGQDLCIHGTPEMAVGDTSKSGCVSLAPIDAKDVYMILGLGSKVSIR
ncbi:MAG: L,D-transpeptidase family protein [Pirellulales bacterium]